MIRLPFKLCCCGDWWGQASLWVQDGGRVPKAIQQAEKVKALVAAGVDRVKIQEQLGMSKASYYRCLKA